MNFKTILLHIFLLSFFMVSAQKNYSKKKIDSVLNIVKFKVASHPEQTFSEFKKLYAASLEQNHKIGISFSLIGMGQAVGNLNDFKEAISYVKKGRIIANEIDNDSLLLYADFVDCIQYGRMLLNIKAVDMINDCIKRVHVIKDEDSRHLLLGALYTNKANFSAGLKNKPTDQEFLFLHRKAFYHFSKVKHVFSNPSFNNLGHCFNELNQLDSAYYYFQKGVDFAKLKGKTSEIEYINFAELYVKRKKYPVAMKYLDSSIAICKQKKIYYLLSENFAIYANIHSKLGNTNEAIVAQNLFLMYKDSADMIEKSRVVESVNYLINETKKENDNLLKIHKTIIIVAIILIIVLVIISRFLYCKRRLLKSESSVKENELVEKTNQIVTLKQKVSTSYSEVIAMAKKNDPLFLPLFKELYPDFYNNLLSVNPDLTLTEQKVCFYIKLKFSSKEIASSTFVTTKAIQNRKNRLRKRLSISNGENIYEWFDQL